MKQKELFFDKVEDYLEELYRPIANARESVDVNVYILENDSIGEKFFKVLEEAAQRGIRCRLLIDGFGAIDWIRHQKEWTDQANLQIRVFNPIPTLTWKNALVFPGRFSSIFLKLNRRDHKKMTVIDQDLCMVGSINITEKSLNQKEFALSSTYGTRECQNYFDFTWERSLPLQKRLIYPALINIPKTSVFPNQFSRCNYNISTRRENKIRLYNSIRRAKDRIWIVTPYFAPTPTIIKELIEAKKRGVDVRIVLPQKPDIAMMKWVARYFYPELTQKGISVFEYCPKFLHAKVTIIDEVYFLGSSNADKRSLFTNLEVDLYIQQQATKQAIDESIMKILEDSEPVASDSPGNNFFQRLIIQIYTLIERVNKV